MMFHVILMEYDALLSSRFVARGRCDLFDLDHGVLVLGVVSDRKARETGE